MLSLVSRNLKSKHLLIFIAFIIIAIIITDVQSISHSKANTRKTTSMTSQSLSLNTTVHTVTPATPSKHPIAANQTVALAPTTPTPLPKASAPTTTVSHINHQAPASTKPTWQVVMVKSGDSLSRIFTRVGIHYNQLDQIMHLAATKPLKSLRPGQQLHLLLDPNQQLQQLQYAFNDISTLSIKNTGNHFTATVDTKPLDSKLIFKSFAVRGSIATAAQKAGLNMALYAQLQHIFNTSVNFKRNVRAGDRFDVLYQEYYLNGRRYKTGNIMLASFASQHGGQHLTAIRYTDPKGKSTYYTPSGNGLETAFLTKPLQYRYISSYFSLHRLDPYLHRYHPHLGVDYAAPAGTPVHSVGEGTVAFKGWFSGYGNTVIIHYSSTYKALYGHMARFASNLKVGQEVSRGQVIGYVGSTGWATGAHLHFSWFVHDIPRDPLKFIADATAQVPDQYRHAFLAESKTLLNELQIYRSTEFAENKTDSIAHHS